MRTHLSVHTHILCTSVLGQKLKSHTGLSYQPLTYIAIPVHTVHSMQTYTRHYVYGATVIQKKNMN